MESVEVPAWVEIIIALAGTLGTALLGLLGRALNKWTAELAERHKLTFLANVDELVMGFVTDLYNSEVEAAKKVAADGKLTVEEKAVFKRTAVETIKKHVGVKQLSKVLGSDIDAALGARVEKAVTVAKNAGKAARSPLA